MGPQVHRGADGGGARAVGGALAATTLSLHIHLLAAPPSSSSYSSAECVCRYTHRHTGAERERVDYSDCPEERRAEQENTGL